jgi:hypothetical protein
LAGCAGSRMGGAAGFSVAPGRMRPRSDHDQYAWVSRPPHSRRPSPAMTSCVRPSPSSSSPLFGADGLEFQVLEGDRLKPACQSHRRRRTRPAARHRSAAAGAPALSPMAHASGRSRASRSRMPPRSPSAQRSRAATCAANVTSGGGRVRRVQQSMVTEAPTTRETQEHITRCSAR